MLHLSSTRNEQTLLAHLMNGTSSYTEVFRKSRTSASEQIVVLSNWTLFNAHQLAFVGQCLNGERFSLWNAASAMRISVLPRAKHPNSSTHKVFASREAPNLWPPCLQSKGVACAPSQALRTPVLQDIRAYKKKGPRLRRDDTHPCCPCGARACLRTGRKR